MASLLEIKGRIKAVKNTRKITKAMQLVAASKMKQFQRKAVSSRTFTWDLLEILNSSLDAESNISLCEERETGKTVFILYSSDKGLCGALNSRLTKTLMNSDKWNNTPEKDRILITIGKKSFDFATYNEIPVEKSFNSLSEKLTPLEALELVDDILKLWNKDKVKEVVMTAPHYKNSLTYYPVMKTYLPFTADMVHEHLNIEKLEEGEEVVKVSNEEGEPPMIYEPDEERFQEQLVEQIIIALFMQSFLELKAAEYSSRMIAMQNATDAAGDIIDRLTLQFNKARQAAITQEIAELVAGSMA